MGILLCNISGLTVMTRHFQHSTYSKHILVAFNELHSLPSCPSQLQKKESHEVSHPTHQIGISTFSIICLVSVFNFGEKIVEQAKYMCCAFLS